MKNEGNYQLQEIKRDKRQGVLSSLSQPSSPPA
jgi:hypothetical protein